MPTLNAGSLSWFDVASRLARPTAPSRGYGYGHGATGGLGVHSTVMTERKGASACFHRSAGRLQ